MAGDGGGQASRAAIGFRKLRRNRAEKPWHTACYPSGRPTRRMFAMTTLIAAAPAPARKHADEGSLLGYLFGSGIFVAGVIGLFSLAGFPI